MASTLSKDSEIAVALQRFIDETPLLSPDGEYMRDANGIPMALHVIAARDWLVRNDLKGARWLGRGIPPSVSSVGGA